MCYIFLSNNLRIDIQTFLMISAIFGILFGEGSYVQRFFNCQEISDTFLSASVISLQIFS